MPFLDGPSEIAQGNSFTLDIYGTKGMLTLLHNPLQIKGGDLNGAHARNFLDCVKSRQHPAPMLRRGTARR